MVQVKVAEGILEGEIIHNKYGKPFYSFKGIPYANPPVGQLRFKAPRPPKSWEGVRSAKSFGNICYQYELFTYPIPAPRGSEDCLYLNVYTPDICSSKPVMVWIHGGAFMSGSGNDNKFGPEFLVAKDVVLVTFNYRLEVLGFLCLENEDIPGNAGMKDQVAAMKWVKKNIKNFGGDPNNITIFGESAGGISVSLHLISPMSKGLFKNAIIQSGTIMCWWPYISRSRDKALILAKELGCMSSDDKDIYDFLMKQPVQLLIHKKVGLTLAQEAKEVFPLSFGIVSEKKYGNNETFLEGDIYDMLRKGIHEGVTVINGYNEDEGTLWFQMGGDPDEVLNKANKYIEYFVPHPLTISCPITTQIEIGKKFKDFYMNGNRVSKDTLDLLMKFFGMEVFVYSIFLWQNIICAKSPNKVYLYKFTGKTERNISKYITGTDKLFHYRTVVSHGDELPYLFPFKDANLELDMNSKSYKIIEQITTLWTNFAKYSEPTPDHSLGVQWKPYTINGQEYLEIGEETIMKSYPDKEEIEFWVEIFKKYYPNLAP